MADLVPHCPLCGTRLWARTGVNNPLWACGRFPECSFEVMDSTIQEAKRRHLQRVTQVRISNSGRVLKVNKTAVSD